MSPPHEERRPLAGNEGSGGVQMLGGGEQDQRNPRPSRADIELARLRARLRYIAHAAGRPLRSRADEAEHSAARRVGEVARMRSVGE